MSRIFVAISFLLLTAAPMHAQRVAPGARPGARMDRSTLERRFRERFEQILQQRLALTDSQLSRVIEVNARLDTRRRALFAEERAVRLELREALQGPADAATQDRIDGLLQRTMRVQRARLDLAETEQRELSAFLTPLQRAQYLGLQEQLRRRLEDMRRRALGDSLSDVFGPDSETGPTPRRRLPPRRPGPTP